jgi:hypothetical protein
MLYGRPAFSQYRLQDNSKLGRPISGLPQRPGRTIFIDFGILLFYLKSSEPFRRISADFRGKPLVKSGLNYLDDAAFFHVQFRINVFS